MWAYCFGPNGINVATEEHPFVITQVPLTPRSYKEKIEQIIFETFNAPAILTPTTAVCALFDASDNWPTTYVLYSLDTTK